MKPYTPVPMDVFWLVVRPYCTVWCMLLRSKDRVPSVHPSRTALFFNFSDPAPAAPIKKGTHHFILLPSLHHFFIISSSFSFSLHHCHPTNRTIIRQKGMFWKIGWLLFYKRENMVDITMFSKLIFATESLRMLPIGIYVFCFSVCLIFIFFPTESLRMIPIGIYVFFLSVLFLFFFLRNHCAWFPLESMFFCFSVCSIFIYFSSDIFWIPPIRIPLTTVCLSTVIFYPPLFIMYCLYCRVLHDVKKFDHAFLFCCSFLFTLVSFLSFMNHTAINKESLLLSQWRSRYVMKVVVWYELLFDWSWLLMMCEMNVCILFAVRLFTVQLFSLQLFTWRLYNRPLSIMFPFMY